MPRVLLCLALLSGPAPAQPPAEEPQSEAALPKLRVLPEPCPAGGVTSEIVVCGRRNEDIRYRLPLKQEWFDPKGPVASVSRERNRLLEGQDSGLGSCSTVGPGGMTGCHNKGVWRKREQFGR